MNLPAPSRRRSLWIGALAIVALLAGLSVLIGQWRPPRSTAPGSRPSPRDTSDVVEQALRQIPAVDSSAIKSRWMDEVKAVDYSALGPRQRELFVRFANARRCTCGCGFTLAACRTYDTTCPVSGPVLEKLRDSVAAGFVRGAAGLRERPRPG